MDRQGYWSSLVIPIVRALERIAIALEAQKPKEEPRVQALNETSRALENSRGGTQL